MIKNFFYFFDFKQKRTLVVLLGLMFMATFLEMLGLGFIFSIIGTLGQANLHDNFLISKLSYFLDLNKNEIISHLLVIFLLFYVFKIVFLVFYNWFESSFLYSYRESLSSRVFKEYLNQNFSYFYNRNSSEFIRNLITEVDQFTVYLIAIIKLVLEIIIIIGIFCFLAYVNFYFTVLISAVFLLFAAIYFFLFKNKLNEWGIQRQTNMQKKIQFMQEGFDGIKIIKLLGREEFFFNKFKLHNVNLAKISTKTFFFQGMPKLLFELIGIFLISASLFILYYSGKDLIAIVQIISIYVAASFRILPSANKIVSSLQLIKLNYPAMNVLFNELKKKCG